MLIILINTMILLGNFRGRHRRIAVVRGHQIYAVSTLWEQNQLESQ